MTDHEPITLGAGAEPAPRRGKPPAKKARQARSWKTAHDDLARQFGDYRSRVGVAAELLRRPCATAEVREALVAAALSVLEGG